MPDLLPLTNAAISDYRNHLESYPNTDQSILDYLVRHINGLMCSEIEQAVTDLFRTRLAEGSRDASTRSYVERMLGRSVIRNARFREIRNKLDFFGNSYSQQFYDLVYQSVGEDGIERLGIAVGKRDADAHETPPSITFEELEAAFEVANIVMDAVQQTLET